MVRKGKAISYEDIIEAQKKRDEKDTAAKGRPGRKRKRATSSSRCGKKSRVNEIEEARCEIKTLGMKKYCSIF